MISKIKGLSTRSYRSYNRVIRVKTLLRYLYFLPRWYSQEMEWQWLEPGKHQATKKRFKIIIGLKEQAKSKMLDFGTKWCTVNRKQIFVKPTYSNHLKLNQKGALGEIIFVKRTAFCWGHHGAPQVRSY